MTHTQAMAEHKLTQRESRHEGSTAMREQFEELELEIIEFKEDDVIRTSCTVDNENTLPVIED